MSVEGGTRAFVWYYVNLVGGGFIAKLASCLCSLCMFSATFTFSIIYGGKVASHENVLIRKINGSPGYLLQLPK